MNVQQETQKPRGTYHLLRAVDAGDHDILATKQLQSALKPNQKRLQKRSRRVQVHRLNVFVSVRPKHVRRYLVRRKQTEVSPGQSQ